MWKSYTIASICPGLSGGLQWPSICPGTPGTQETQAHQPDLHPELCAYGQTQHKHSQCFILNANVG